MQVKSAAGNKPFALQTARCNRARSITANNKNCNSPTIVDRSLITLFKNERISVTSGWEMFDILRLLCLTILKFGTVYALRVNV